MTARLESNIVLASGLVVALVGSRGYLHLLGALDLLFAGAFLLDVAQIKEENDGDDNHPLGKTLGYQHVTHGVGAMRNAGAKFAGVCPDGSLHASYTNNNEKN